MNSDFLSFIRTNSFRSLILAGSGMLAACVSSPSPPSALFDLRVTPTATPGKPRDIQLLVPTPTAIDAMNSDRIVVRLPSGQGIAYLPDARWADRLPQLVGARLVDELAGAHVVRGIGMPGDGLAIDNRLLVEISRFDLDTSAEPKVEVRLGARLINEHSGKVIASSDFPASEAVASSAPDLVAAGFETAFNKASSDLSAWVGTVAGAK